MRNNYDDTNDEQPAGTAMLERLQSQLAGKFKPDPALFRVVEVTRDSRGRLQRQGQIWHSDLNHVRRFARAVAANSVSQGVVVADAAGGVLEQIPVAEFGTAGPAGWGQWRDMPLPPAPPVRKKAKPALPKTKLPAAIAAPDPLAAAAALQALADSVPAEPATAATPAARAAQTNAPAAAEAVAPAIDAPAAAKAAAAAAAATLLPAPVADEVAITLP